METLNRQRKTRGMGVIMSRSVFLIYEDEEAVLVGRIRELAGGESSGVQFIDYPIEVDFSSRAGDSLRMYLRRMMGEAEVVLVMIGETTCNSSWANWEIKTGSSLGKGLVGVRVHSSSKDVIPSALRTTADGIINWDTGKIVEAIDDAARKAGYK